MEMTDKGANLDKILQRIETLCIMEESECSKRGVGAYKEADDGKEMTARAEAYEDVYQLIQTIRKEIGIYDK